MALPAQVTIRAWEFGPEAAAEIEVAVSAEYHFTIAINGNPIVRIACSGSDLEELAIGHLVTEGIVRAPDDVRGCAVREVERIIDIATSDDEALLDRLFAVRSIASGCGQASEGALPFERPVAGNRTRIAANVMTASMREFLHASDLHRATRGVHSAALYTTGGERIVFYDEIGRHNAIDKLAGYALMHNHDVSNTMLLSTGRLSSEIVGKAVRAGVPVVASKASPTSLGVELARASGLTLIGKVRGERFCAFSGIEGISE